jgi:hypothetical protein
MSLSLRTHKGKKILYVDYGVLNFENMIIFYMIRAMY